MMDHKPNKYCGIKGVQINITTQNFRNNERGREQIKLRDIIRRQPYQIEMFCLFA